MNKFKVGDEVWVKGVIKVVDALINKEEEFSYKVILEDGERCWFDEDILHATNAKNAQVQSKYIELALNEKEDGIIINTDKIISLNEDIMCVTLEECYQYELTEESYNKLKERLLGN